MIQAISISAMSGDFALREISFHLPEGATLALLGPSGSGKTMLLETLLGLRRPDSGAVRVDGRDVTAMPPERRNIAYLPQDVALFPHLSVMENMMFGAQVRGLAETMRARVGDYAEMLRISHLLSRKTVTSLSGGEAQRVAFARALLTLPKVLFLDECFAAVDATLRWDLHEILASMHRELRTTVVLVTHELEKALLLADFVAVMMGGRLAQTGTPDDLFRSPADEGIARFLGIENILPVEAVERSGGQNIVTVGGMRLTVDDGKDADAPSGFLAFAAAEVEVLDGAQAAGQYCGPNSFDAKVLRSVNLGHSGKLYLGVYGLNGMPIVASLVPGTSVTGMPPGTMVRVRIHPRRLRRFDKSSRRDHEIEPLAA